MRKLCSFPLLGLALALIMSSTPPGCIPDPEPGDMSWDAEERWIDTSEIVGYTSSDSAGVLPIRPTGNSLWRSQREVSKALYEVVNSGRFNITKVETTYNYGFLVSADVFHDAPVQGGRGHKLRMELFVAYDENLQRRQKDIDEALETFSMPANVIRTKQATAEGGYRTALEIYYEKP